MQACLCVGNTRPGVSGRESRHMLQRTVTDPCSSCLQPVKNNKAPERQTPTRSNDLRTVHQQYTNDVAAASYPRTSTSENQGTRVASLHYSIRTVL